VRERERERKRETKREKDMYVCVRASVCVCVWESEREREMLHCMLLGAITPRRRHSALGTVFPKDSIKNTKGVRVACADTSG